MLEAAKERVREILESGDSEEQINAETNEFVESIAADIDDAVQNGEISEVEFPALIKELEI
jgi:hypothetical protein